MVFIGPVTTPAAMLKEIVIQKQNGQYAIIGCLSSGSGVKYDSVRKWIIYRNVNGCLNTGY